MGAPPSGRRMGRGECWGWVGEWRGGGSAGKSRGGLGVLGRGGWGVGGQGSVTAEDVCCQAPVPACTVPLAAQVELEGIVRGGEEPSRYIPANDPAKVR